MEGLHVPVLLRCVLPDELVLQAQRPHGFSKCSVAVLWAVVGPDPQVLNVSIDVCYRL